MWKTIYDKLKAKGLNPYPPGIHKGLCTANYCVVKEGNQIPSINSNQIGQSVMDIILFIPYSNYPALDLYKKSIRTALAEIPNLRKTGFETTVIADNDKEAMTMSIEYVILRKLEG